MKHMKISDGSHCKALLVFYHLRVQYHLHEQPSILLCEPSVEPHKVVSVAYEIFNTTEDAMFQFYMI